MTRTQPIQLRRPLYFALGLKLLAGICRCRYGTLMALGRVLGRIAQRWMTRRARIAKINIALCFPDQSSDWQAKCLKHYFESTGMAMVELWMTQWVEDARLKPLIEIEGAQHYQTAQQSGRGIILLSAHINAPDFGARIARLMLVKQSSSFVRKQNAPHLEQWFCQLRACFNETLYYKNSPADLRRMMRDLKNGAAVWLAPDQDVRHHHVFVDFFGVSAATTTLPYVLAKKTNAVILPIFFSRKSNNLGYRIEVFPGLDTVGGVSPQQIMQCLNHTLETVVRAHPEQYFWMHRRFKTRPAGEKALYS